MKDLFLDNYYKMECQNKLKYSKIVSKDDINNDVCNTTALVKTDISSDTYNKIFEKEVAQGVIKKIKL